MSTWINRYVLWIAAALLAGMGATSVATAADAVAVERTYSLFNIDTGDASLLLSEKLGETLSSCGPIKTELLNPHPTGDKPIGYVKITCTPAIHERIAEVLKQYDVSPRSHTFQIVLLEGSTETTGTPSLAPGPQKALEDIRQVLPFKGYRLLDTGLLRTADEGSVTVGQNLYVTMIIRSGREASQPMYVRSFRMLQTGGPGDPRPLIMTSFSIKTKETVVVGTSKLDGGDKALVVLVTALDY
jgi:hypothetical protein